MLKTLNYKVDSAAAVAAMEAAPGRINAGISSGVELALGYFQKLEVENILSPYGDKPRAVAFGTLAQHVDLMFTPGELHGAVVISPPADIYADPVETGTRPHFPPIAPIIRWVIQKGLAGGTASQRFEARSVVKTLNAAGFSKKDAGRLAKKMSTESEAEKIAHAIAWKIYRKGTRGHFFAQRAFDAGKETALLKIDQQVDLAIQEINSGGFAA